MCMSLLAIRLCNEQVNNCLLKRVVYVLLACADVWVHLENVRLGKCMSGCVAGAGFPACHVPNVLQVCFCFFFKVQGQQLAVGILFSILFVNVLV